jgi:hypothetical protein
MMFKTGATHGAPSSRTRSPLRTLLIAVAIFSLAQPIFAICLGADGVAVEAALAAASPNTPYSLEAQALLGNSRTDLYLTAASSTLPQPNVFNLTPRKNVLLGDPGANDPAPGKRPLGNTSPVIVFAGGEPVVISGTPGGIFIPQVMFQVIVNLVDHHMSLEAAVKAPRFWLGAPEAAIDFNGGLPDASLAQLKGMGQKLGAQLGGINVGFAESIGVDPESVDLAGVPDIRGEDSAAQVLAP